MGIEQKISDILEGIVAGSKSDTEAAQKLGVGQVTLHGWRHPRSANKKNKTLYDALDRVGAKLIMPNEKLVEYALVPKRAARPGAGSSLETSAEVEGLFAFRKDWLNKLNIPTGNIELFDVMGDSMEPTLRNGDTLLVDKNDTEIMDGKIYVVSLREELLVKRVQQTLDGFTLLSDNKGAYDPIPVTPELKDKFRIHGRVRWFGREL